MSDRLIAVLFVVSWIGIALLFGAWMDRGE